MAQWYYKVAEQVVGPLSAEQLKALAEGGRLAPGDPVAKSKEGPWVAASRVKGLFEVAAVDDEPEEQSPPPQPVAEAAPTERPVEKPPIPQPPVVMSSGPPSQPSDQPSGPTEAAPPAPASGPAGRFAISTEEVAATERFQKKKRVKKPKEPLTKKQKNTRLVKWLAVAIVLGGAVLFSIPYLRKMMQSASDEVAASNPITADVNVGATGDSLENLLGPSSPAGRSRPTPSGGTGSTADGQTEAAEQIFKASTSADTVEVKPVRVVLDRPQMTNANGDRFRTTNRFLLVELELKTKVPDESARFRGWLSYAKDISMIDEHGVQYDVQTPQKFRGMFVEGQCMEMVFLSADKPTTDVIVFAWPEGEAPGLPSASEELLKLTLPKGAYGEQGELRIAIPLSEIDVTEHALAKPRGKPPAAESATSDNVEGDDGGPIRIPGLTD